MKYTPFFDNKSNVSRICLGTMNFGDKCDFRQSDAIVNRAVDLGINFFDTAPMYSAGVAEEFLGRAIGGKRDEVFIATKVHAGLDEATIVKSLEESLARMRTDRVDLYLIHWPAAGMSLKEMMSGLARVAASGKARYVGCCNFPAWLVGSSNLVAAENGWPKLACNQIAYNLIERGVEVEVLPQAVTEGLFITAYRPLAVGLLTGTFRPGQQLDPSKRGTTDSRVITWLTQHGGSIERFVRFSEARGYTPAQIATAWVNHSPAIGAPIVGASSTEHVEAAAASTEISLSDEDYRDLTDLFDTEVKEEGLQRFPGLKYNYPRLRRSLFLARRD